MSSQDSSESLRAEVARLAAMVEQQQAEIELLRRSGVQEGGGKSAGKRKHERSGTKRSGSMRSARRRPLILNGHTRDVNSVAVLLEKDRYILSGSADMSVRIWSVRSAMCKYVLEGHTGQVLSVASLADQRAVSASSDHSLRVWSTKSGKQLAMLTGHKAAVSAVARIGAGASFVSGSYDNSIAVWNADNVHKSDAKPLQRVMTGHTDRVWALAASPQDLQQCISASRDASLRVWDLEAGSCVSTLSPGGGYANSVAYAMPNIVAAACYDHHVKLFDLRSGKTTVVLEGHSNWVASVACSSDAKHIFSGGADRELRVWDWTAAKCLGTLGSHTAIVYTVAMLDRDRVISGNTDHGVYVYPWLRAMDRLDAPGPSS